MEKPYQPLHAGEGCDEVSLGPDSRPAGEKTLIKNLGFYDVWEGTARSSLYHAQ